MPEDQIHQEEPSTSPLPENPSPKDEDKIETSTKHQPPNPPEYIPIPDSPPWDLLLTIDQGYDIPVGDIHGKSDCYILGKLKNVKNLTSDGSPSSRIHFRTSTQRRTREPKWNESWRFGGVRPGTYLKLKLYDEDPRKEFDDKLGSVKYTFRNENMERKKDGKEYSYCLYIRNFKGRKHIQVLTEVYDLFHLKSSRGKATIAVNMQLIPPLNSENLDIHLQNPTRYSVHSSPLVNLLASPPSKSQAGSTPFTFTNKANPNFKTSSAATTSRSSNKDPENSRFKAYKIQLIHPPPPSKLTFTADASHAKSFDPSKLRRRFAHHLIKKQYQNIYGHDSNTEYGSWWNDEQVGMGLINLIQPNIENKLFTFVVTEDGEWRFCETGDEYRINHLSKHSMHSGGNDTVSWSGEFFVREKVGGGYIVVLDNDSGTYSPDKDKIGDFEKFMRLNLKGVDVEVRDHKDGDLKKAKKEQKGKDEEEDDEKNEEPKDEEKDGEHKDKKEVEEEDKEDDKEKSPENQSNTKETS